MMTFNRTCSLVFAVMTMIGCSFGYGFAATSHPEDLAVAYQMNPGSLPSPYYHEISITVQASGSGEIQLTPDYPEDSVPQWTESFQVEDGDLDTFYTLLQDQGAFSLSWQAPSQIKTGSISEVIQITANGSQTQIPTQVVKDQMKAKDKIAKGIKALVPDSVWQSLETRHQNYSKEKYPTGATGE